MFGLSEMMVDQTYDRICVQCDVDTRYLVNNNMELFLFLFGYLYWQNESYNYTGWKQKTITRNLWVSFDFLLAHQFSWLQFQFSMKYSVL